MATLKAASMKRWAETQKARSREIALEAAAEVGKRAQENAPEDKGDLKESLVVEVNGARVGSGREAYEHAVKSAKPGDRILVGWTAPHAKAQEFGITQRYPNGTVSNRPGKFYLGKALMEWPTIVKAIAAKKRGRQ